MCAFGIVADNISVYLEMGDLQRRIIGLTNQLYLKLNLSNGNLQFYTLSKNADL